VIRQNHRISKALAVALATGAIAPAGLVCFRNSGLRDCNRHRPEHELAPMSVATAQPKNVVDEIELDLKVNAVRGYERRAQAAGGYAQRHVPGVIDPGRERQTNLADDLCPQL